MCRQIKCCWLVNFVRPLFLIAHIKYGEPTDPQTYWDKVLKTKWNYNINWFFPFPRIWRGGIFFHFMVFPSSNRRYWNLAADNYYRVFPIQHAASHIDLSNERGGRRYFIYLIIHKTETAFNVDGRDIAHWLDSTHTHWCIEEFKEERNYSTHFTTSTSKTEAFSAGSSQTFQHTVPQTPLTSLPVCYFWLWLNTQCLVI